MYEEYFFKEAKTSSQTRITRQAKIARAVGSLSTSLARKQNDPLIKRMQYHLDLYKRFKNKIMTKYASRVKAQARR